jgi:NADPH-dependent 2,4-dienoyl-CoA reductase/sulfur reductase-like enzyme
VRSCSFDVLAIGAGPGGLAAAVTAAEDGARVGVVDAEARVGGQVWRAERGELGASAGAWVARARASGVRFLRGGTVFDAPARGRWTAIDGQGALELAAPRTVLATGAVERFLPFPGWTLPGVCGAGGLQALVKGGLDVDGARVVVAGSGPLLLAVAAFLRARGAEVLGLFEQAPRARVARLAPALLARPAKLAQALELAAALQGVPQHFDAWPLRAEGDGVLRRVVLRTRTGELPLSCDWLACGFGLAPAMELARLAGCALEHGAVAVDALQRTSVADLWCVGESAGIGGVDLALAEGEVAGHAAAGREERARAVLPRRERERAFARALEGAFALRDELRTLCADDTLVCRCEDVPWSALRSHESAREAKLLSRCGMGACQGRVCGPALEFLRGWERDRARPPLVPVPLRALVEAGAAIPAESEILP